MNSNRSLEIQHEREWSGVGVQKDLIMLFQLRSRNSVRDNESNSKKIFLTLQSCLPTEIAVLRSILLASSFTMNTPS